MITRKLRAGRRTRTRRARKQTRRAPRRVARRSTRPRSNTFGARVLAILNRSTETKYVAFDSLNNYVLGSLPGDVPARQFKNLIPPVALTAQPTAHSRVGNEITPVNVKVTIQYYFQGTGYSGNQTGASAVNSGLYEIRQFAGSPKGVKSLDAWQLPGAGGATTYQEKLLELGNGTTIGADSANPMNLNYKFSDENWRITNQKHIVMGKNFGMIQQSETAPLANVRSQNTEHFWLTGLPKKFKYDDDNSSYPTNFLSLLGIYAGVLTNQNATASPTYDGLLALATGTPTTPILRYNYRVEMWYKDD